MKNLKLKPKLDKISQSSSPQQIQKQIISPLKTGRGRHIIGGLGDSYLSFFKIENQIDPKVPKIIQQHKKIDFSKNILAEKDLMIHNLQQKLTKQTLKKNARQKCFNQRLSTNWKKYIQNFVHSIAIICLSMCKDKIQHKKSVLKLLHQSCTRKLEGKKLIFAIIAWILQWLQPILRMLHQIIQKKYI